MTDTYPPPVPPAAAAALLPGEHVYWTGRPDPKIWFQASDLLMMVVGVMFTAFAVFWELGVLSSGAPLIFQLWGIPFILVGLYIAFGRLAYRAWQRGQTTYVLTDQRALALIRGTIRTHPSTEGPREITTRSNGTHVTLQYGDAIEPRSAGLAWGPFAQRDIAGVMFENVPDVAGLIDASRRATTHKGSSQGS